MLQSSRSSLLHLLLIVSTTSTTTDARSLLNLANKLSRSWTSVSDLSTTASSSRTADLLQQPCSSSTATPPSAAGKNASQVVPLLPRTCSQSLSSSDAPVDAQPPTEVHETGAPSSSDGFNLGAEGNNRNETLDAAASAVTPMSRQASTLSSSSGAGGPRPSILQMHPMLLGGGALHLLPTYLTSLTPLEGAPPSNLLVAASNRSAEGGRGAGGGDGEESEVDLEESSDVNTLKQKRREKISRTTSSEDDAEKQGAPGQAQDLQDEAKAAAQKKWQEAFRDVMQRRLALQEQFRSVVEASQASVQERTAEREAAASGEGLQDEDDDETENGGKGSEDTRSREAALHEKEEQVAGDLHVDHEPIALPSGSGFTTILLDPPSTTNDEAASANSTSTDVKVTEGSEEEPPHQDNVPPTEASSSTSSPEAQDHRKNKNSLYATPEIAAKNGASQLFDMTLDDEEEERAGNVNATTPSVDDDAEWLVARPLVLSRQHSLSDGEQEGQLQEAGGELRDEMKVDHNENNKLLPGGPPLQHDSDSDSPPGVQTTTGQEVELAGLEDLIKFKNNEGAADGKDEAKANKPRPPVLQVFDMSKGDGHMSPANDKHEVLFRTAAPTPSDDQEFVVNALCQGMNNLGLLDVEAASFIKDGEHEITKLMTNKEPPLEDHTETPGSEQTPLCRDEENKNDVDLGEVECCGTASNSEERASTSVTVPAGDHHSSEPQQQAPAKVDGSQLRSLYCDSEDDDKQTTRKSIFSWRRKKTSCTPKPGEDVGAKMNIKRGKKCCCFCRRGTTTSESSASSTTTSMGSSSCSKETETTADNSRNSGVEQDRGAPICVGGTDATTSEVLVPAASPTTCIGPCNKMNKLFRSRPGPPPLLATTAALAAAAASCCGVASLAGSRLSSVENSNLCFPFSFSSSLLPSFGAERTAARTVNEFLATTLQDSVAYAHNFGREALCNHQPWISCSLKMCCTGDEIAGISTASLAHDLAENKDSSFGVISEWGGENGLGAPPGV
ncbi:unnamed protein product [Amoebophrya sp. A120]|nr:unnamed protein product [Amoebophrya sp. A120]|eukprot:GSA120T00023281001.1